MVSIETLEWDTKHFGIKVGRLTVEEDDTLSEVLSSIAQSDLECLIARTPVDDVGRIKILEDCGFRLKDIRVHLDLELANFHPARLSSGVEIQKYRRQDLEKLRQISGESFWSTHFHLDKKFIQEKVNKMYELWIDKAVKEKYSIFVARKEGVPVGFLASNVELGDYYIELVAVAKKFRGKGIGKDLLNYSLRKAKLGFKKASIAVQLGNITAIRLYEKLGFKINSSEATFHWWRHPNG
jgi:GNAT superfamily N-acetyltransferase